MEESDKNPQELLVECSFTLQQMNQEIINAHWTHGPDKTKLLQQSTWWQQHKPFVYYLSHLFIYLHLKCLSSSSSSSIADQHKTEKRKTVKMIIFEWLKLLLLFLLPQLPPFTWLILKTVTSLKGFEQKHLLGSFSASVVNDLFFFKILWHY